MRNARIVCGGATNLMAAMGDPRGGFPLACVVKPMRPSLEQIERQRHLGKQHATKLRKHKAHQQRQRNAL